MRPRAEGGRDKAPLFIPYDPASKSVRGRLKSQVSAHVARRAWRNGRPAAHASSSSSETSEEEVVESPTHMVRRDGSQVSLQPILKKLPTDTPDSLVKYLYDEYMPNFLPGMDPKSWIEAAKSSPAMYYGLLFKAQAQYRMQPRDPAGGRESHDVVLYGKGVKELNKAMPTVTDQNIDALVCAVAFLAFNVDEAPALTRRSPKQSPLQDLQWLRMVSSYESKPEHLQGLLRLLQQRGGLHNIKVAGAAQALSYGDIRDATRYLRHPGLPFVALGSADKRQTPSRALARRTSTTPLNPTTLKVFFSPNKGYPFTNFADAIDMIVEYVHLVNTLMPGGIDYRDAQLIDSRNLTQYILMSVPFLDDLIAQPPGYKFTRLELEVYELCRLATMVFSLLMVFPLPPKSAPFHQIAKQIRSRASNIELCRLPIAICTWILYIGAVASIGYDNEHAFFINALIARNGGNTTSWEGTRAMLMSCLWDTNVSDEDGIEIWAKTQSKPG